MNDIFLKIISLITVTVTVIVFVAIIAMGISNESQKIDEGVIIDKQYHPGYIHSSHSSNQTVVQSVPPRYVFTIEGEKNGEIVQYYFEVTPEEYNKYQLGDWYER